MENQKMRRAARKYFLKESAKDILFAIIFNALFIGMSTIRHAWCISIFAFMFWMITLTIVIIFIRKEKRTQGEMYNTLVRKKMNLENENQKLKKELEDIRSDKSLRGYFTMKNTGI